MSSTAIHTALNRARQELLDLTSRNRLLNTPRSAARSNRLDLVDELSQEVFRRLVVEKKTMSFLPVKNDEDVMDAGKEDQGLLVQPSDDEPGNGAVASRHTDDKLQTSLTSERLQKKLLKLFYDARTYQEEQGVNILYLALGFLKWYEDQHSDRERYAPLLLVPVALDRQSANARFKIHCTEDEIATNLSLQARLKRDFGIELPDVPDEEEFSPSAYYEKVAATVQHQRRWEVLPNDMVLWFFSFSKFLMYRDLEPENWPEGRKLEAHPLIRGLLEDGFRSSPSICGDDDRIDPLIHPIDMIHVLDADSSQALIVEEVKRGHNLVVQGPPGTGKSQTIANMIASAVKAGKSVLFVAEKMAALEVVRRRLDNIGLGDLCLELHSHKANKRTVLQDLASTLGLGKPQLEDVRRHCEELAVYRDRLNRHLEIIHSQITPCGLTPYQIVGELVRLRANGTKPPDFQLDAPLQWSRAQFETKLNLLRDLLEHVSKTDTPKDNPWRGVELDVILPMDVDRLMAKLPGVLARLEQLLEAGQRLASLLGLPSPVDAMGISHLARLAQRLSMAPPMDRRSLASPAWEQKRPQIDMLLATGKEYSKHHGEIKDVVTDAAWDTDVASVRRNMAAYGRSWLRIFYRVYREASAALRGILVAEPPKPLEQRLAILDHLIQGQKARAYLQNAGPAQLGQAAFGSFWNGCSSDWPALSAIAEWEAGCCEAKIDAKFRLIHAQHDQPLDVQPVLLQIREHLKPVLSELEALLKTSLKLNLQIAFGTPDLTSVPLATLADRLHQWQTQPEALSHWVGYDVRRRRTEAAGMAELVGRIHNGEVSPPEAIPQCEMAYYGEIIRDVFHRYPELASFNGESHTQLLETFKRLDEERLLLARHEVAMAHFERLPKNGSDVGEVGKVRREIEKKRGHLPIRKLLAQAGRAVQAIKPVFMMSPISVAQYLEPGAIDFDLLLIDEASQVQPVDALGAIARAKQVAVVGDNKQLPPTRFFSRMAGDDGPEESEQDDVQAGNMESVLGLCSAQGVPSRMLRWHYRSRHHSLIAVSNHEFYDDRLYVVPSPANPGQHQGLVFRHIAQGVFDRGGSASNRIEAKVVAEAVMAHARQCPSTSLGVGTFSVAQRDAILDELELLRRADPSLEQFFATAAPEPFFVKNLENIQGDERDVIFISVGYGKDASGYMAMNFGPLGNDGGERRLNVLITRARQYCEVFSSIQADDIDLTRARSRGAQALKTFLQYAATGQLDTGIATGREHDSEFERQVARAVRSLGYEVHPQVGVAGFFIDLAVVDPTTPGRYLIGIECDGVNYHSSRSARDRDRLREAVLRDRGWIIHRIWSTDWFQRPEEQLRKTAAAIEAAKIEWASRVKGDEKRSDGPPIISTEIPRHEGDDDGGPEEGSLPVEPYTVASFRIVTNQEIHELPPSELAKAVVKVIEVEGPIHREEITRRVTQLWGLQRAGRRIQDAVARALQVVTRSSLAVCDGEFFSLRGRAGVRVRDRGDVPCPTVRRPDMLPPAEIREAILAIVQVHLGVTRSEAITEAARLFGFRATSAQLRQVIESEIEWLISQHRLDEQNRRLHVKTPQGA
jgi:very-short-patch-repair endonuclease